MGIRVKRRLKVADTGISKDMPPASHIPPSTISRSLESIPGRVMEEKAALRKEISVEMGMTEAAAEAVILPARLILTIAEEAEKEAEGEKNEG